MIVVFLQQGSHFIRRVREAPYLPYKLFVLLPVGKTISGKDFFYVLLPLAKYPIHMLRKSYYIHQRISL
jgi:hypothetical protein